MRRGAASGSRIDGGLFGASLFWVRAIPLSNRRATRSESLIPRAPGHFPGPGSARPAAAKLRRLAPDLLSRPDARRRSGEPFGAFAAPG